MKRFIEWLRCMFETENIEDSEIGLYKRMTRKHMSLVSKEEIKRIMEETQ